jgi:hypothetical protein
MFLQPKLLVGVFLAVAGCAASRQEPDASDAAGDRLDAPGDGDGSPDLAGECYGGMVLCGGTCVDIRSDHENCGACGNACEPAVVCSGGECILECPGGMVNCSGSCVDLSSDENNCGACGAACPPGLNAVPLCGGSLCGLQCLPGWSDMDDAPGCELNCEITSPVETCDGIDENCNGAVDEGFECALGATVSCDTTCGSRGRGTCGGDCTFPAGPACAPPDETCNGIDDDCDGQSDDGFPCPRGQEVSCTSSCGTAGRGICTSSCGIPTGPACPSVTAETCNGIDDDCDDLVDEDFACRAGASESCTTSCGSTGSRACGATCVWGPCDPPAETCNGVDDDCDTLIDEGCTPAAPSRVTITQNYGGNPSGVRLCWTDNSNNEALFRVLQTRWNGGSPIDIISELPANTTCFDATYVSDPWHFAVSSVGSDGRTCGYVSVTLPTSTAVFWVNVPCSSTVCTNAGDTTDTCS